MVYKMKNGKKGQIFTLDVFLAIAALVAAIGYASFLLEEAYSSANDLQFQRLDSIANDWAQIGVKRSLAIDDADENRRPNVVEFDDGDAWGNFVLEFTNSITDEYGAELSMETNYDSINEGCDDKPFVAVARRLVVDDDKNVVDWLKVKVCYA